MSNDRNTLVLLAGACIIALACTSSSPGPAAPDVLSGRTAQSAVIELAAPDKIEPTEAGDAAAGPGGGSASGHAEVHATAVQNVQDERYSFNAKSTGTFPLAAGQFEAHLVRFTGEEANVHAEVTCLVIIGNRAWIGARITKAVQDGVEVPNSAGVALVFTVQDMGEGAGTNDLASLHFLPRATVSDPDIAYCNTRGVQPILRESTKGNIQVRPDE